MLNQIALFSSSMQPPVNPTTASGPPNMRQPTEEGAYVYNTYTYVHTYTCMHTNRVTCIPMHMNIYIYIYIHICMHFIRAQTQAATS